MTLTEQAYINGFRQKCAEFGISAEDLMKTAQATKLVDGYVDPDTMNFRPPVTNKPPAKAVAPKPAPKPAPPKP